MDYGKITLDKLPDLITAIQKESIVFGPVKRDEIVLERITDPKSFNLDYSNFSQSPKSAFFPKCEKLFSLTDKRMEDAFSEPEPFVLFGVRPCDTSSFELLDLVFAKANGGFADPYYSGRQEKGIVISYACDTPCETCFCSSFESGGPSGEAGADVIMHRLGDDLVFKGISEKGKTLLEECRKVLSETDQNDLDTIKKQSVDAEKAVHSIDTSGTAEKVKGNFYDAMWKEISDKCVGCGICTFLCPTCHCFDVTDEKNKNGIDRIRVWDSCQFSMFTLHASGHNPRPSQTERMRQRVLHKFSYTVSNFDRIFCVGCGRCVKSCPVNLDIRETIKSLNTLTPKKGEQQ